MFRVYPPTRSPMRAMTSESGMETAVMSVSRTDSRKTRITSTANSSPSMPSTLRSWIESSMNGAWSKTVVKLAPLPSAACRSGRAVRTPCDTLTVLPAGVLVTARVNDGLPLTREIEVVSTGCSRTSAMSDSGTGPSVP